MVGLVEPPFGECGIEIGEVQERDPSNNQANPSTQAYQYDELNRLTSVTQPWAGAGGGTSVTAYSYDVQDHLASVTDANGNLTSYVYSDRDLMTRQVSPISGQTNSTYNEHGELTAETDARAITMSRTVDALDRVTAMSYPDTSLNVTYQYDMGPFAKRLLIGITRYGETVAYAYDRFGRLTQDGTLAYTYDANGNRSSIGYPGGSAASYTFDFADREQSLSLQVGSRLERGGGGRCAALSGVAADSPGSQQQYVPDLFRRCCYLSACSGSLPMDEHLVFHGASCAFSRTEGRGVTAPVCAPGHAHGGQSCLQPGSGRSGLERKIQLSRNRKTKLALGWVGQDPPAGGTVAERKTEVSPDCQLFRRENVGQQIVASRCAAAPSSCAGNPDDAGCRRSGAPAIQDGAPGRRDGAPAMQEAASPLLRGAPARGNGERRARTVRRPSGIGSRGAGTLRRPAVKRRRRSLMPRRRGGPEKTPPLSAGPTARSAPPAPSSRAFSVDYLLS